MRRSFDTWLRLLLFIVLITLPTVLFFLYIHAEQRRVLVEIQESAGVLSAATLAEIDALRVRNLGWLGIVSTATALLGWVGSGRLIRRRSASQPDETLPVAAQRQAGSDSSGQSPDQTVRALEQRAHAEALVRIGARLNAHLDLETIFQTVGEETARALNVPIVIMSLYDPYTQNFIHTADFGLPPEYREKVQPVPRARIDALIEQSKSALPNAREDGLMIRADVRAGQLSGSDDPNASIHAVLGVRTVVGIHMKRDRDLIGRLTINTVGTPREFTTDELALLKGLTNQAAQAIINARLYEDAQRRLGRLAALHAIDEAILSAQELPATLELITQQVANQLRVDAVAVLLYDEEAQTLTYAAGTGFRSDAIRHSRLHMGEGHAGRAAQEGRVQVVADLAQVDDFVRAPLLVGEDFVSYYAVPLVAHGQVQGVLDIFLRAHFDPPSEWMAFLNSLALQTAIAVEHARLFAKAARLLENTQRQARQLEQILDTVPEGVLLLDDRQQIVLANPLARSYLEDGLAEAPTEVSTETPSVLRQLGDLPIGTLLAGDSALWHEVKTQSTQRIFEVAARLLPNGERVTGWVLVLRDVTEERRRRIEQRTNERLATVGHLAAGIAHDFNNILTPILIYSELVQLALPQEHSGHNHLQQVATAVNRAKELIEQILTFSRQRPQERKPLRLQPIVSEALKLLRAALPSTIEIEANINEQAAPVLADPTQIHQVVMNLCTNAHHAMTQASTERGGLLTVSLDMVDVEAEFAAAHPALRVGPYVRLAIGDTGHGMSPETLEHIFEPFFTTKPVGEGTGMGLAVVHGIILSYGGEIVVESAPGQGSLFQIYLPPVDVMVDDATPTHAPLNRGLERVLVVDDEGAIASATRAILESLGYTVTCETDSRKALATFRATPHAFDLVITDLTMPHLTGAELAGQLLAIRSDLGILLVSGTGEGAIIDQALASGIAGYLSKPFSVTELSQAIRRVLDGKK